MAIASTEADFPQRLADWIEALNAAFGVRVNCSDGQCRFMSRDDAEVVLSASAGAGALFMTAVIGTLVPGDTHTMSDLMARNLFQRQTNGGWFALEPEGGAICFQYRWDRYPIAELDEFLLVLQSFIQAAESFARNLKTVPGGAAEETAASDYTATIIRA